MIVVGCDSSLSSTGLARIEPGEGWWTERVTTAAPRGNRLEGQAARMRRIARHVRDAVVGRTGAERADLFVIEGLAVYGKNTGAGDLAGLWWRLVSVVTAAGVPVLVIAPPTRAKYAAGSGNADKHAVLAAVRETYPDADVPNHDVADAVALAALGARLKDFPVERVERHWVEDVVRQVADREEKREQG